MSRRVLLPLLALLAVLVPGALVASGCGAEEAAGVDVAKAATATSAKGTAEVDMEVRLSGMGLPGTMELEAEGVTALSEPRMDLEFDLGSLLSAFGVPAGDAEIRVKIDGAQLYVRPPAIAGFQLPDGAKWASLDLRKALEGFGMDADALGKLFNVDPAAQLKALDLAKDMKQVGREKIDDVDTTHFRGQMTARETIAALPPEQRKEAEKAIKELEGFDDTFDQPLPYDFWIDDDNVVRRMVVSGEFPGEKGVPAGKMRVQVDLSDFGAKLDTSPPPAGETFDATGPLLDFFKNGLSGLLGPQFD